MTFDQKPVSSSAADAGRPGRPNDVDLPSLLGDLQAARTLAAQDVTPGRNQRPSPQRAKLLACMEAYAAALTARRLPIPPRLRDDLRLLRGLCRPESDDGRRR